VRALRLALFVGGWQRWHERIFRFRLDGDAELPFPCSDVLIESGVVPWPAWLSSRDGPHGALSDTIPPFFFDGRLFAFLLAGCGWETYLITAVFKVVISQYSLEVYL